MINVNKTVIIAVALAFALGATALAKPASAPLIDSSGVADIVARVQKSVIQVEPIEITSPVAAQMGGGGGSGFIIDKQAHFITNHHVSGGAPFLRVILWDESTYRAHLIATEPGIDILLCQIDDISPDKVFPAALGDSDSVKPGEMALAMGNPGAGEAISIEPSDPFKYFMLRQTATCKVVAGKETPVDFEMEIWSRYRGELSQEYGTNLEYVLRMATAINPGNSGGPLFDRNGEVIGINFFGGGFSIAQNNNYAVPINFAKDFALQILEHGKFERSWLGMDVLMPRNIHDSQAYTEFVERYRPKNKILIYGVRDDSPARAAGLMQGDEMLQVDGKTFSTPEDLRTYILRLNVGDEVSLTVRRGTAVLNFKVKTVPKRRFDSEFSV
jgi:S1-C subfamily serine protease